MKAATTNQFLINHHTKWNKYSDVVFTVLKLP
jgi:hypothetical protein